MTKVMEESDWTPEKVLAFWDHCSRRPGVPDVYFSRMMRKGIRRFLKRRRLLSGKVLDFGCGPGYLCEELVEHGVDVWGAEPSPQSRDEANRRLSGHGNWRGAWEPGELDKRKFGAFDLVTCVETLEHVPAKEEQGFLRSLRRLIRPGGRLFLTVPNEENLSNNRSYCPFCDSEFHTMQHMRALDRVTLSRVLFEAGFAPEYVDGVNLTLLERPKPPSVVDMSLRSAARFAMRVGLEAIDFVARPHDPVVLRYYRRLGKMPHLCAVARVAE